MSEMKLSWWRLGICVALFLFCLASLFWRGNSLFIAVEVFGGGLLLVALWFVGKTTRKGRAKKERRVHW